MSCKKKTSLYHVISSFILAPSGACASSHEISSICSHILTCESVFHFLLISVNCPKEFQSMCALVACFHSSTTTREFFLSTLLHQIHQQTAKAKKNPISKAGKTQVFTDTYIIYIVFFIQSSLQRHSIDDSFLKTLSLLETCERT